MPPCDPQQIPSSVRICVHRRPDTVAQRDGYGPWRALTLSLDKSRRKEEMELLKGVALPTLIFHPLTTQCFMDVGSGDIFLSRQPFWSSTERERKLSIQ